RVAVRHWLILTGSAGVAADHQCPFRGRHGTTPAAPCRSIGRSIHSPAGAFESARFSGHRTSATTVGPDRSRRPMRIYEGSARQDFEEVFRSIGAYLDRRGMREILLTEAPDGFIVQGLVMVGSGTWSDTMGQQVKETLTFLDDDIARFMDEAI